MHIMILKQPCNWSTRPIMAMYNILTSTTIHVTEIISKISEQVLTSSCTFLLVVIKFHMKYNNLFAEINYVTKEEIQFVKTIQPNQMEMWGLVYLTSQGPARLHFINVGVQEHHFINTGQVLGHPPSCNFGSHKQTDERHTRCTYRRVCYKPLKDFTPRSCNMLHDPTQNHMTMDRVVYPPYIQALDASFTYMVSILTIC